MSSQQTVDQLFEAKDAACFKVVQGKREFFARGPLKVLRHGNASQGVIFVLVQNFQYPLRPDIPILKAAPRTYIFTFPGNLFYGIVLPQSITAETVKQFEEILSSEADLHSAEEQDDGSQASEATPSTAIAPTSSQGASSSSAPSTTLSPEVAIKKVESGIEICSRFAAQSMISGAHVVGKEIRKGSKFVISKVKPVESPVKVSESTKSAIRSAKMASVSAISVSAALVTGAVAMSASLATALAKSFSTTDAGKKIIAANSPTATAAKSAAVTTVTAVEHVLLAAFEASNVLLKGLGDSTTEIVTHTLGKEAGDTSREVFDLTGDLIIVTRNMNRLGVTSIASATVVAATKNVLSEDGEHDTAKTLTAASTF